MTRDLIELLGFEDISSVLTFVIWIAFFAIAAAIYAFYKARENRIKLQQMKRQMKHISDEVHHVDDNLTAINRDVSHLQDEVEHDLPRELHRMDERVDAAKITALHVKDDIEDLEENVGKLETSVTGNIDKLDSKVTSSVDKLDSKVTSTFDKLDTKVTSSVDKLDTKVTEVVHEIQDTVGGLSHNLHHVEKEVEEVHHDFKGVQGRIDEVSRNVEHVEREVDDVEHHVDVIALQASHPNNPASDDEEGTAQKIERIEIMHKLKKQRERIDDKIDSYLEFDDWLRKDEAYYDDLYDEARERYDDMRRYLTDAQVDAIEIDRKQVFAKKAALFETGVNAPESEEDARAYHQAIKHMFISMRKEVVNRIIQLERSSKALSA